MEPILFWYPSIPDEDSPGKHEQGKITAVQLAREPYEAVVETMGYSFHLVFGKHTGGMFLCIPNWDIGCELASLSDYNWNRNSLLNTGNLDEDICSAVAWSLSNIGNLMKLLSLGRN